MPLLSHPLGSRGLGLANTPATLCRHRATSPPATAACQGRSPCEEGRRGHPQTEGCLCRADTIFNLVLKVRFRHHCCQRHSLASQQRKSSGLPGRGRQARRPGNSQLRRGRLLGSLLGRPSLHFPSPEQRLRRGHHYKMASPRGLPPPAGAGRRVFGAFPALPGQLPGPSGQDTSDGGSPQRRPPRPTASTGRPRQVDGGAPRAQVGSGGGAGRQSRSAPEALKGSSARLPGSHSALCMLPAASIQALLPGLGLR